jgi:uncharacterized protein
MRQALAVAAKAPQPGKAKTRLHSFLAVEDATQLYRCFLKDTLVLIDSVPATDAIISYTPEGAESYFEGIAGSHHRLLPQRGVNFGEKLRNVLEDLLGEGYDCVVVMDSDSPTLPTEYLGKAFELLRRPGPRVVLGPAVDGGYYLIGLNGSQPRLFEDITWSTSRVLGETIERAGESHLKVELLPEWYDVDDLDSFDTLRRELGLITGAEMEIGSERVVLRGLVPASDVNPLRVCVPRTAANTRSFLRARWPATNAHAYD